MDLLSWVAAITVVVVCCSVLARVIYRLPILMEREWNTALYDEPSVNDDKYIQNYWHRAVCSSCGSAQPFLSNSATLGCLLYGNRCTDCNAPKYIWPLWFEAIAVLMVIVILHQSGLTWLSMLSIIFTLTLLVAAIIDIRTMLLPDQITQPLLWLGILLASQGYGMVDLQDSVMGAISGYSVLLAINTVLKMVRLSGIGEGDFKLMASIGAWLGVYSLPLVIMIATGLALVYSVARVLVERAKLKENLEIPFGPYLAAGGLSVVVFG